jgi:UDP-N-acetylglucosamine--dolichyl-phosphate N-acetylglucosaminephosphotransferase
MSTVRFKERDLKFLGRLSIRALESMGLLAVQRRVGEYGEYIECNNFTLVNLILKLFGPMHEQTTTIILLLLQVSNSFF